MLAPAAFGGDAQRLRELAVVDLMILRAEHAAGDLAGKVRLARARVGSREPFQRQVEPALEFQPMQDLALVVRGQSQHQRALAPQFDVDAARAREALRRRRASAPGCRGRARPGPPRQARLRSRPRACRPRHGSRRRRPCRCRKASLRRAPASRQAMPSPTTPAPIMATRGRLPAVESEETFRLNGGSLRWNDPDRFDGFDLSRVFARHPWPMAK